MTFVFDRDIYKKNPSCLIWVASFYLHYLSTIRDRNIIQMYVQMYYIQIKIKSNTPLTSFKLAFLDTR